MDISIFVEHKWSIRTIILIPPYTCGDLSVGYFDGAASVKAGGAGFVIYLSETHYFCFSMGCGSSSNTRAELLALWAVLRVSHLMGLPMRSIFGDSMVIISWINQLSALDLPTLTHWCEDIKYMKRLAP